MQNYTYGFVGEPVDRFGWNLVSLLVLCTYLVYRKKKIKISEKPGRTGTTRKKRDNPEKMVLKILKIK